MTHVVITTAPALLSVFTNLRSVRFAAMSKGVPVLHPMPSPHTAQLPLLLTSYIGISFVIDILTWVVRLLQLVKRYRQVIVNWSPQLVQSFFVFSQNVSAVSGSRPEYCHHV